MEKTLVFRLVMRFSYLLLGRRGMRQLLFACFAAIGISCVELSISVVLQMLLVGLGLTTLQLSVLGIELPKYSLVVIASVFIVIGIVRFIVQLVTTQSSVFLKEQSLLKLRQFYLQKTLFDNNYIEKSSSDLNFKISEVFFKSSEFIGFSVNALYMLLQSCVIFLLLFFVAWKEASLAAVGIFIIGIFILKINKNISNYSKQVPVFQKEVNEGIEKITRNFLFIKLMKKREQEYASMSNSLWNYSSRATLAGFFSNLGAQTGPLLGIILLVFIIVFSNQVFLTNAVTLISFIYLLARFVQSISILSGYVGNAYIYFPQYKMAMQMIGNNGFSAIEGHFSKKIGFAGNGKKNRKKEYSQLISNFTEIIKIPSPKIVFDSVDFSYPNGTSLFRNLNIQIVSGSQVGIVGHSGTGKSTLLMLLLGQLLPTRGHVYIDGTLAEDYVANPKIRIGYVGADPFLIKGSIRKNLCYGLQVRVSDNDLLQVLEQVSLTDLLNEKGLDYEIGENHFGLSAGQKQRICLARAILNLPALLILDEATANLDETNEGLIADILHQLKKKCTTVIVSHRPKLLVHSDVIFDINQFK